MRCLSLQFAGAWCAFGILLGAEAKSAEAADPLQTVIEQNRQLQEQVRAQQKTIDELNGKMADLLKASERHERTLHDLEARGDASSAAAAPTAGRGSEVRVAAEAGMAFFQTGSEGQFPKAEFRADDPVVTIEAPVWKNVYLFSELKLLTRETNAENFQLGEIYVDFEDVSAAWGQPGQLNFRAGRVDVPFGEEYMRRGPVENPLISHSLQDIWGQDEGMEIYGRVGPVRYVGAVQNGGTSRLHDFNADKAIAGRLSWEPTPWLGLSGSAMRTGELGTTTDQLSDLWFADGFFRALGPASRTGKFWANLAEADGRVHWKTGHVSAVLGRARFNDSDPAANDARHLQYGSIELVQTLTGGLYGAVRASQIHAPGGYPLAGWGNMGKYFFSPLLTERLRRTSVGLGYRFADPLVLKFEYAWESGRMTTGAGRDHEDFFGSEIGVKF